MIRTGRESLHRLVDELPPAELPAAERFLEFLRARAGGAPDWREVRERLEPFAEEWDSPEMAAYDDYDAARG